MCLQTWLFIVIANCAIQHHLQHCRHTSLSTTTYFSNSSSQSPVNICETVRYQHYRLSVDSIGREKNYSRVTENLQIFVLKKVCQQKYIPMCLKTRNQTPCQQKSWSGYPGNLQNVESNLPTSNCGRMLIG